MQCCLNCSSHTSHTPALESQVCLPILEQCEGWLQLALSYRLCVVQATEDFIVHLLEDCNLCAIHAKRVTISKRSFPAADITSLQQRCAPLMPCISMSAGSCTPLLQHAQHAKLISTMWTTCVWWHVFTCIFHCSAKGHAAGKENQRSNCWCFILLSLNKQDLSDTLKSSALQMYLYNVYSAVMYASQLDVTGSLHTCHSHFWTCRYLAYTIAVNGINT